MTDMNDASANADGRLALEDDLTIYHAAAHKAALLAALAATDRLELDLSAIAEIDTAGLQLLILVKREAAARGKSVVISGHSAAVRQTIDFCSLAVAFGDPMVIPAGTAQGSAHG
jgi:anti-anti-sigma factor